MEKPLLLAAALLVLSSFAFADVIMPGTHPVDRCVKISNLDEYPDVALIGFITGPMMHPAQLPPVIQGNCLEKGYKFNQLSLYWAKKSDLGPLGVGGLKIKATPTLNEGCTNESGEPCYYDNYSIDSANVHPVNFPEDVGMYYTSDADPKTGESITYSIAGICGNELILYRSGQTTSYGLSSRKETFPAPTLPCKKAPPQPNPQPVPATPQPAMGFFESIVCFFKSLFGASC